MYTEPGMLGRVLLSPNGASGTTLLHLVELLICHLLAPYHIHPNLVCSLQQTTMWDILHDLELLFIVLQQTNT